MEFQSQKVLMSFRVLVKPCHVNFPWTRWTNLKTVYKDSRVIVSISTSKLHHLLIIQVKYKTLPKSKYSILSHYQKLTEANSVHLFCEDFCTENIASLRFNLWQTLKYGKYHFPISSQNTHHSSTFIVSWEIISIFQVPYLVKLLVFYQLW